MSKKFSKSLKRTVAFTSALALVASLTIVNVANAEKDYDYEKYVTDYTSLMPGLSGAKLKLSDPQFTKKDWYEYIEYEYYTQVEDGNTLYRIYKPSNYNLASVMAIGDHQPDDSNTQLGKSMNLSIQNDLKSIFDMAAQGQNISQDFAALDITSGIADSMNNIGEVMDNSKYYSNLGSLGIPGDKKYSGISNSGFYTASSISIAITDTQSITAGKTVSVNSNYNTSRSAISRKDYTDYNEASKTKGSTTETGMSVGLSIGQMYGIEDTLSQGVADTVSRERTLSESFSHTDSYGSSHSHTDGYEYSDTDTIGGHINGSIGSETEIGGGFSIPDLFEVSASETISLGLEVGIEGSMSNTETISSSDTYESHQEHSDTYENSYSVTDGISRTRSREQSQTYQQQHSIDQSLESNSSFGQSLEDSLTQGSSQSTGREQENSVAVDIGYGVDYMTENGFEHSVEVTRTFDARDDELVKGVGWKLCDYVVKVPFYVEAIDKASFELNPEDPVVLFGQYVEYNLIQGVCRVFANGYIEHWYTGDLVNYAGFFDGFITVNELLDKAKSADAKKVPKGA